MQNIFEAPFVYKSLPKVLRGLETQKYSTFMIENLMRNGEEKQGNSKLTLCRIKLMLQGRINSCGNSERSN